MRIGYFSRVYTMKTKLSRYSAGVLAVALFASIAAAQSQPRYKELPNFRKLNERLYAGAQPQSEGIKKLAELGIKSVINLRGADELTRADEAEARALGLRYYSVPLPGLSRPSEAQVARVMTLLNDQGNWPVFVHCKRGSDRTGTILACYRVSHEGWTARQALYEAEQYGMSWIEFGMKDFISDYYTQQNGTVRTEVKAATGR